MAEDATTGARPDGDQWMFLIDPAWQDTHVGTPPVEAVVGGWFVERNGQTGRFHANPDYEPSHPDSPTDPVDATLRLVVRGEAEADQLLSAMADGVFGVAVNTEQTPVVVLSPDEVPSVVVATAPAHSRRISQEQRVDAWAEVTLEQLVGLLPEQGVDVLLNPGAPASIRLLAAAVRETVGYGRNWPVSTAVASSTRDR